MLQVDDLRFRYPGHKEDYLFSFAAEPGQITAIGGASGSGKSTLLDLLAGFLQPLAGNITLDGRSLIKLMPEQRPVSLLLQSESLFDHLSARENVVLGLPRGTGRAEARQRAEAALAEVDLSGMGEQVASTLSGGQKQRVALARTLLRARPVLLLDEPFSALDDDTRAAVRSLVQRLTQQHGWHTLLVSHHLDDLAALASRRYLIHERRIQQIA